MSRFAGGVVVVLLLTLAVFGAWYYLFRIPQMQQEPTTILTVGATLFPLADIIERVGGEHVDVILFLPPGVSEHAASLSPQALARMQRGKALFAIGHGLDDALVAKVTKSAPAAQVVLVDEGITLRPFTDEHDHEDEEEEAYEEDEGLDPHYWLTISNGIQIAKTVAATLTDLDPANEEAYQRNVNDYSNELQAVEERLQAHARTAANTHFIAMHNAWGYFAPHYGFELVGTYEPREGQAPSLADLEALRALVREYSLTTFFSEPQKATTAVTRLMQQDFGLRIQVLDPVGGRDDTDSFAKLIEYNVNTLVAGSR